MQPLYFRNTEFCASRRSYNPFSPNKFQQDAKLFTKNQNQRGFFSLEKKNIYSFLCSKFSRENTKENEKKRETLFTGKQT